MTWSGHWLASAQARFRTKLPSGVMRPVSSASGMNSDGGNEAARRMRPAQQRLEADDVLAHQIDERLVVHFERFGGERRAQIDFQLAARLRLRVHLRLEKAEGRFAGGLGAIQRQIGVAQQVIGIMAIGRRHRDADGRADGHHVALDDVGLADDVDETLRQHGQLLRRLHFRHQHGELIAAEPRRGIALPQRRARCGRQHPAAAGRRWDGRACR